MAKTKGHTSLYEILKGPLGNKMSAPDIKVSPQVKVQESEKVFEESPKVIQQEIKTPAEIVQAEESHPPASKSYEFGERVIKLTYNSAVFFLIVTLFLLFVAFAYGLKVGRRLIEPRISTSQSSRGGTIMIAQLPYTTQAQQQSAIAQAQNLESAISGVKYAIDKSGRWLVIYYGSFTDKDSEDARESLKNLSAALKKYSPPYTPRYISYQ